MAGVTADFLAALPALAPDPDGFDAGSSEAHPTAIAIAAANENCARYRLMRT